MGTKLLATFRDFSAGLNVKDAANLIPENALTESQNAVIGNGYVAKRPGYEQFAPSQVTQTLTWQQFGGKKWSDV